MALTFRTLGPWGAGKGAPLEWSETDTNFWELAQSIVDLTASPAVPVGIASISVTGTQMFIVLTDGTVTGPFTLPVLTFRWRDEWQPSTSYAVLDVVQVPDVGIFMVQIAHTSGATFDPDLLIGGLPAFLTLFGMEGTSPGSSMPTGTMLSNISGVVGPAVPNTLTAYLDNVLGTSVRGTLLFRGATSWRALAPGIPGQILSTHGATGDLEWIDNQIVAPITTGAMGLGTAGAIGTGIRRVIGASAGISAAASFGDTAGWSTTDKDSAITITGKYTASQNGLTGAWRSVRSTSSKSSGKFYFEWRCTQIDGVRGCIVGLAPAAMPLTSFSGHTATSIGAQLGSDLTGTATFWINNALLSASVASWHGAASSVNRVAVEFTGGGVKIWIQNATRNNGWNEGSTGTQNPDTGAGGISLTTASPMFICFSGFRGGGAPCTVALNTGNAPFAGAVPVGFSAWG